MDWVAANDTMLKVLVIVWLAGCAYCDARSGQVPNGLTLPGLALAALVAGLRGWPELAVFGVALITLAGINSLGAIGGADAKILAALVGLWPEGVPFALAGIALWAAGRRILGRRGNFRALPPMWIGSLAAIAFDKALFFP